MKYGTFYVLVSGVDEDDSNDVYMYTSIPFNLKTFNTFLCMQNQLENQNSCLPRCLLILGPFHFQPQVKFLFFSFIYYPDLMVIRTNGDEERIGNINIHIDNYCKTASTGAKKSGNAAEPNPEQGSEQH